MSKHLIHRQILDLNYSNANQAKSDMSLWSERFQSQLQPVIEEVLDELDIPDRIVRIGKIEINLGNIRGKLDPDELRNKLREQLKTQILRDIPSLRRLNEKKANQASLSKKPHDQIQKKAELLIYLLENGKAPWWANQGSETQIQLLFLELVREKNEVFRDWFLKKKISTNSKIRLVNHLSFEEIKQFLQWVLPQKVDLVESLYLSLKSSLVPILISDFSLKKAFKRILIDAISFSDSESTKTVQYLNILLFETKTTKSQKTSETNRFILNILSEYSENQLKKSNLIHFWGLWVQAPFFNRFILTGAVNSEKQTSRLFENLISQTEEIISKRPVLDQTKVQKTSKNEESHKELEIDETLPISNAGLVLVGPFIPYFFKGLGLVEGKEFVSFEAQNRAILLLEGLIDTSYRFEESDLLLNKILCGVEISKPIEVEFEPTKTEKEEMQNLLDSMAGNWTALKTTSGQSLARGFFPREGSLSKADRGYQLIIPRISIDILLNRLPWGISIIKHPWMKETLFTEW